MPTLQEVIDDALMVGTSYNRGVVGATNRSAHAKLGDVISVKDFGAVGDGVNNDTTEIQAAINYVDGLGSGNAVGGELYFPHGLYLIQAPLQTIGRVTFRGSASGSVITAGTSFPAQLTAAAHTFDAPMLWIDRVTSSSDSQMDFYDLEFDGGNNARIGVLVSQGAGMTFHNLRVYDVTRDGFVLDGLQNSLVIACRISRCGRDCIRILNGTRYPMFLNCFTRDPAQVAGQLGANVRIGPDDTQFPGQGNILHTTQCFFYGGLHEGSSLSGTSTHCVAVNGDGSPAHMHVFHATSFFGQRTVAQVEVSNPRCLFDNCSFAGGSTNTQAMIVRSGAVGTRLFAPRTNNVQPAAGNHLFQVDSGGELKLTQPFIQGFTPAGGSLVLGGAGLKNYEDKISHGTTGERPDMSLIDATAAYFDTTLGKPIWWNGSAWRTWGDAMVNA